MPTQFAAEAGRSEHLVLVHSPIVGPDTWELVAEHAREQGHSVIVPELQDTGAPPYWQAHTRSVAAACAPLQPSGITVVAHSGAGQLLPHIGRALVDAGQTIDAYLLLDAGLPTGGGSRLDQLEIEDGAFSERVRAVVETPGGFPDWTDEQLEPMVPHAGTRRQLLAGVRRLPLEYWAEPMPVVTSWPGEVPCGVVLTSATYEPTATAAMANGWPLRRVSSDNHFRLLADPRAVTAALLEVRAELLHR